MNANLAITTTDDRSYDVGNEQSFPQFRQAYNDPEVKWQIEVQKAVVDLVSMPEGWDSYGAPAVKRDAGLFAIEILHNLMRRRSPIPHVVPSSIGGVQLEWHEKDIDLEIHVVAPYQCEVWFHYHGQGEPQSIDITNDFSPLEAPIRALTNR